MSKDSDIAIKIENLSKQYRLGQVGTGTLSHDLNRMWAKVRGKEDPFAKVGEVNDRSQKAESDYIWALKEINLEVKKGEILGVIGANGAGKSTLLKIISRITAPSSGSIKVNGRIASLLEVGTGMHPEMTARENIFMNGAILGMRKYEIARKLDDIIDFAGIAKYIDTPVKRFSSGMRVRLGFAVAAYLEPEILIVDEVLAVGDAEFQKRAIGKMQEVSQGEGRTVLFVSHNMSSISKLCLNSILMKNGKILLRSPSDVIISEYLQSKVNKQKIDNNIEFVFIEDDQGVKKTLIKNTVNYTLCFSINSIPKEEYYNIGLEFKNSMEETVFTTTILDCNEMIDYSIYKNSLTCKVPLPKKLFFPGNYTITLNVVVPGVILIYSLENILNFTVYDEIELFKKIGEKRSGKVLPIIPWVIEGK